MNLFVSQTPSVGGKKNQVLIFDTHYHTYEVLRYTSVDSVSIFIFYQRKFYVWFQYLIFTNNITNQYFGYQNLNNKCDRQSMILNYVLLVITLFNL